VQIQKDLDIHIGITQGDIEESQKLSLEKALKDKELEMKSVKEEGKKEGKKEGKEEGKEEKALQVACAMLEMKYPLKDIAFISGLSIEKIEELERQHRGSKR
jgi:predicted transposase/invertase (TIGR01784 family)